MDFKTAKLNLYYQKRLKGKKSYQMINVCNATCRRSLHTPREDAKSKEEKWQKTYNGRKDFISDKIVSAQLFKPF